MYEQKELNILSLVLIISYNYISNLEYLAVLIPNQNSIYSIKQK